MRQPFSIGLLLPDRRTMSDIEHHLQHSGYPLLSCGSGLPAHCPCELRYTETKHGNQPGQWAPLESAYKFGEMWCLMLPYGICMSRHRLCRANRGRSGIQLDDFKHSAHNDADQCLVFLRSRQHERSFYYDSSFELDCQ